MSPRFLSWLAVPCLAAVAYAAPSLLAELRVRPDPNQVVASRLEGAWEPDPELGARLGTKPWNERLEFQPDENALASLPAALASLLEKDRIWQAGTLLSLAKGVEYRTPYALVTHTGNSVVVVFRSREGRTLDDAESFILTLVPAADRVNDLLFTGGDFNNEPFRAFRRVAPR